MNVARKIDKKDAATEYRYSKKSNSTNEAEIITLVSKNPEDKKVTLAYLNEKLNYFYNNGGPIMDI